LFQADTVIEYILAEFRVYIRQVIHYNDIYRDTRKRIHRINDVFRNIVVVHQKCIDQILQLVLQSTDDLKLYWLNEINTDVDIAELGGINK